MERVDIVPVAETDIQIGLLLSVLDDVTNEWTEELGDVSDEALVWQPVPNGHSIGALLLHIADVEAFWIHQVGANQVRSAEELKTLMSEETDQYGGSWPVPPSQPLSWYLEQMRSVRQRTRDYVLALGDPEHLGRYYSVSRGVEREFTLRWLLNHVISHEAYHGGQAVLLHLLYQAKTTI